MTGLDEGVPLAWCQLRQGRALHMEGHQLHTCNGESMAINLSFFVEMAKICCLAVDVNLGCSSHDV